ncbi:DNA repair protein rad2 [Agyrium rufum]|nr:DNA repair protein rad2 [Agyrium rufum]
MGVTGLWSVLQPCARPIKLETLNRKRLAVDASIWIYQFLKAVRDKEGNALRNSHIVGFFRRICKLLFFGIKPVFVFDGGAPTLKRQTISARKARREGRREDAVRTAGKLLALQMQRRAEEGERQRKEDRDRGRNGEAENEEAIPDEVVYADEIGMSAQERAQGRTFKKKDAYHLPDLDVRLDQMGAPNDPRIMSHEELEEYARQFHTGEDINIYDFSKIDFDSDFFLSLPASDRYNILNAARLRSRLRMGYSKEQLDTMFPDRMAFSRFQVERVTERNELTTRLMNINGMNGEDAMLGINKGSRIAGERGKEYVLVKNDAVEGGWALGVVSNKPEGERSQPIDVERVDIQAKEEPDDDDAWEDEGFEDVPIEGLNRLPRLEHRTKPSETLQRRQDVYKGRQRRAVEHGTPETDPAAEEDPHSLFLPDAEPSIEEPVESPEETQGLFEEAEEEGNDDEELQRAIAMSLQNEEDEEANAQSRLDAAFEPRYLGPRTDQPLDFNPRNARVGRDFAHLTNARANRSALKEGESAFDLQAALAESRDTKYKSHTGPKGSSLNSPDQPASPISRPIVPASQTQKPEAVKSTAPNPFGGPLPFESIDLGKSMLRKKKTTHGKDGEEVAGGFEKQAEAPKSAPLPPWFSGDVLQGQARQKAFEEERLGDKATDGQFTFSETQPILRRAPTNSVIDLDAPSEAQANQAQVIDSSSDGEDDEDFTLVKVQKSIDSEIRMGDVADLTRAEPPTSSLPSNDRQPARLARDEAFTRSDDPASNDQKASDEEMLDWSDSDVGESGEIADKTPIASKEASPIGGRFVVQVSKSPSPEFEDVGVFDAASKPDFSEIEPSEPQSVHILQQEDRFDIAPVKAEVDDDEFDFSDPEDEELMRQLATEAEEHARFASSLNSRSQLQSAEDYERELRQLRNQQKKDRRDADEVSHIMITECQQLLKLFGLPYITAPMEAEAQCAELVRLGLVDGIVTDDSDTFLFGGTRVYKNMFNQAKFVECYLSSDLEKEYSLDRGKIIQIAHLLGSDYTDGIPSIGPVTALEILSEFENLENFKDWLFSVQHGSKAASEENASPFRRKFRRNATKIFLPPSFPDKRVDIAYLNPEVDNDPNPFQWGVPDLDALRTYLMATIGWTQERADEILVPVIRDMNKRENEGTQANITHFFSGGVGIGAAGRVRVANTASNIGVQDVGGAGTAVGNNGDGAFAPRRRVQASRRMENALGKLHRKAKNNSTNENMEDESLDQDNALDGVATEEPQGHSEAIATTTKNGAKTTQKSKKRAAPSSSRGSRKKTARSRRGGDRQMEGSSSSSTSADTA